MVSSGLWMGAELPQLGSWWGAELPQLEVWAAKGERLGMMELVLVASVDD